MSSKVKIDTHGRTFLTCRSLLLLRPSIRPRLLRPCIFIHCAQHGPLESAYSGSARTNYFTWGLWRIPCKLTQRQKKIDRLIHSRAVTAPSKPFSTRHKWQYEVQQYISAAASCLKDLEWDTVKSRERALHADQLHLHVSRVQAYLENRPPGVKEKFLKDTNSFLQRARRCIHRDLEHHLATSTAQGGTLDVSQHMIEKNFPEASAKLPQHHKRPMDCDVLKKGTPRKSHSKPVEVIDLTDDRPDSRGEDPIIDRQRRECVSSENGADLVAAALDVRDSTLWYDPEQDLDQDMLP